MNSVWTQGGGEAGLVQMCSSLKTGIKRHVYNVITKAEEKVRSSIETAIRDGNNSHVESTRIYVRRDIDAVKGKVTGLKLMNDNAILKSLARMYKEIRVEGDVFTGTLGRLEITWKGSTFYVGEFTIGLDFRSVSDLNADSWKRIKVYNTDKPREATVPHPHVNIDNLVCFGTWKEMMRTYAKDRWNWMRLFVMVGEFLTHYTPEGTPYQKLSLGWEKRLVRGLERCKECERDIETCTCIRRGVSCPKTGAVRPVLPALPYCNGCARLVPEEALRTPEVRRFPTTMFNGLHRANVGLCAGTETMALWYARGIAGLRELDAALARLREAQGIRATSEYRAEPGQVIATNDIEAEAARIPVEPRGQRRASRLNYQDLPLRYRQTYVFVTGPTGTVYRCKRNQEVDETGSMVVPVALTQGQQLPVLRILNADSARRVVDAELIEAVVEVRSMRAHVTQVLRGPSYAEPEEHTRADRENPYTGDGEQSTQTGGGQ